MKYTYIFFITLLLIGCENTNEASNNESSVMEEKAIETVVEPTAAASEMPKEMTEEVMADMKKELEELDMPEEEKAAFIKKAEKNMEKPAESTVAKAKEAVTEASAKAKEVMTDATAKSKEALKEASVKAKEVVTGASTKAKEVVAGATSAKAKEVVTEATNAKPEVKKVEEAIVEKVKPKVAIDSSPRNFVNKEYTVKGNWSIQEEGGKTYVMLHSNFKTKNGPDLKVFLHNSTIQAVSSKNALNGSVLLGKLKSNKGEQKYLVPNNIDITNYKSVLIHCEKYTVLWGGGKLF